MVVLGVTSSCEISVNARAAPPYDNSAHPRILPRVFWSTVFSLVNMVPYDEISIMQGRDNDNYSDLSSRSCFNSNPKMRLPALTLTPSLLVNKPPLRADTPVDHVVNHLRSAFDGARAHHGAVGELDLVMKLEELPSRLGIQGDHGSLAVLIADEHHSIADAQRAEGLQSDQRARGRADDDVEAFPFGEL